MSDPNFFFPFLDALLFEVFERKRRDLEQEIFMSASSDLRVVFWAPLKLSFCSDSVHCMRKSLCCSLQQSTHFFFPTVSMRLRPKRY